MSMSLYSTLPFIEETNADHISHRVEVNVLLQ